MKILQINPYPPDNLGGSEILCKNLALNLEKIENTHCDILTSNISKSKNYPSNLENSHVKIFYKRCFFNFWGKNPVVNIINFLNKCYLDYDLIHIHSYLFFTSLQAALLKKVKKFPLVLQLHGFQLQPSLINGFKLNQKIQFKIKQLIFDRWIGKFPFEASDAIISVTRRDLSLVQDYYDLKSKLCYYIPNGINPNKFKKSNTTPKKYITYIGRLSHIKGFDVFMKIIKLLNVHNKNLEFIVVGDGPLKNLISNNKKKLPIKYYQFYPYTKIQEIYNMSKLLLVTSRFEGLPTTILESLACETPVISTNAGGINEVVLPNINGFIFDIENLNECVKMILKIIEDEETLSKLGKAGRKLILDNFTWDTITKRIKIVYEKVLEIYQSS